MNKRLMERAAFLEQKCNKVMEMYNDNKDIMNDPWFRIAVASLAKEYNRVQRRIRIEARLKRFLWRWL